MLLSFGTEFEVNLESPVSRQTEHKGSRSYTWPRKTFFDSAFQSISESRSGILCAPADSPTLSVRSTPTWTVIDRAREEKGFPKSGSSLVLACFLPSPDHLSASPCREVKMNQPVIVNNSPNSSWVFMLKYFLAGEVLLYGLAILPRGL